ncbi:50S ribosomal protein L25 [Patescibacteria group bacterium]|nr:50S ribosomal protein L25 [Patescibacteria group bacterium]MBU1672896.1 50S ribosomal protein L25 [Patescibacteria group bacterium]MBU1963147.1 50S ribosomal protein L25 [Patescibacteria group bacterium]
MEEKFELKAESREGKREDGFIPGVYYGPGVENKNIRVDEKAFKAILVDATRSTLIDFFVDGKQTGKVLIKEVQRNPLTTEPTHVDFYQVNMDNPINAEMELIFIGESPAEKEMGGILVTNKDKLNIKCLPADLISKAEVDITPLKTFDDSIKVKDISIPEKIEVLDGMDDIVALVSPPRTEEELKALEEAPEEEAADVEVVGEKEKEDAAEGEDSATPEASQESSEEGKKQEEKKEEKK